MKISKYIVTVGGLLCGKYNTTLRDPYSVRHLPSCVTILSIGGGGVGGVGCGGFGAVSRDLLPPPSMNRYQQKYEKYMYQQCISCPKKFDCCVQAILSNKCSHTKSFYSAYYLSQFRLLTLC